MNQSIMHFEEELLERLSRSYYDELLYFSGTVPHALINFNDVLLLKKGQKYINHTEQVFQKSIATLFVSLYAGRGIQGKVCKTDGGKGRGVYVRQIKTRIHFLGQEKFVNFPKVPWFNFQESSDGTYDLYTVTVKKDSVGEDFIDRANKQLKAKEIKTKSFIVLEDFVSQQFGKGIWQELNETMARIEKEAKNYQWFGLINYYNNLTQAEFLKKIEKGLRTYDFQKELALYPNAISNRNYAVLQNEFIGKEKYKILLGSEDFASSYIASEWLFENLNNNDLMEKTYIVTGYIKSIEQLLAYMIQKSANPNEQIGVLDGGGITNVDINSPDFYKATLGNMTYYLKAFSSSHIYLDSLPRGAIRDINSIIKDWVQEERNGYFHKDNVYSTERVSEIRGKTLLLYFLIISAIKAQA